MQDTEDECLLFFLILKVKQFFVIVCTEMEVVYK